MYEGYSVGVVVLAFKVERFIGAVVAGLPDFVDRIYIVDDGSPDGTVAAVKAISDTRVTLIQHGANRGPGTVLCTGYEAASADGMDIIVKVDGDNQMPLEYMEDLIMPIVQGRADYTKGDRMSLRENRLTMPRFRLFGNFVLTWLTRLATGYWRLNDPQNGFTAITKSALDTVGLGLYHYYGYLNHLLVRLHVHHFRVVDVVMPARYGDERSSIRLRRYVPRVSRLLLRLFCLRMWRTYWPWARYRK